jgi:hypothetical protein
LVKSPSHRYDILCEGTPDVKEPPDLQEPQLYAVIICNRAAVVRRIHCPRHANLSRQRIRELYLLYGLGPTIAERAFFATVK